MRQSFSKLTWYVFEEVYGTNQNVRTNKNSVEKMSTRGKKIFYVLIKPIPSWKGINWYGLGLAARFLTEWVTLLLIVKDSK